MGISDEKYMMIKRDKETQELFGELYATAAINGFALLKYDHTGFAVIQPEQYDELIEAMNWLKNNKVKL
jgi:hypothetical protein